MVPAEAVRTLGHLAKLVDTMPNGSRLYVGPDGQYYLIDGTKNEG